MICELCREQPVILQVCDYRTTRLHDRLARSCAISQKSLCYPAQLAYEGLRRGEGLDPALPKFAGRAVAADRLSRRLKATWDAVQASSASAWRAFAAEMAS